MQLTGRFTWRELMVDDVAQARDFYGKLCGWTYTEMEMGGVFGTYTVAKAGEKMVAGIMKRPEMVPVSAWMGYVSVEDVDAVVARARAAGAQIGLEPMDIPDVGRVAAFMDPTGAAVAVLKGTTDDPPPERWSTGEFCWEQVNTADVAATQRFYTEVLGWKVFTPMPETTTFGVAEGMEGQVASIHAAPPGVPSHWMSHVMVKSLADARALTSAAGGKVLMERIEVPTMGAFAVLSDPQGAIFAAFEPSMG